MQLFNRKRHIMNTKYSMGGGALFAALLTSTASFADVTPQEVWDVYKGYMTSYGYTLEADESTSDGVLTISGLSMTMALPEESGELTLSMGDFGFLDQGDGSVLVTLPSVMPINIHVTPTDDEVGDMKLELATSEFSMVASGTIDDMNFATSIGDMSFTLKELVSGGEVMIQATAAINAHKVVSNSTVKSGDLRSFVNDLTIGKFDYSINVTDPDSASEFMMRGETVDLKMASATSIP
ncbi:MAG TPA: hypothetical protein EYP10_00310, partial [Armatimonadetes bacterium]|nr:hypothetical protein [Armatimonadota bacterium]